MSSCFSNYAGTDRRRKLYWAILTALSGSLANQVAYAAPEGGRVTVGSADIISNGDTLTIEQSSQRAVLEFDSFDVGAQETVNFVQPNSDSVALNRVMGSNLSEIHGTINANGHVYLINPNGVLFGEGAQVNVGGLVATTLDMNDQDFMLQQEQLRGATEGLVENRGHINAGERVVLAAPDVINSGTIQVHGGEVALRSSHNLLLQSPGSEIPILLDDPELTGQILNQGSISAERVSLVLDGRGERDVYDNAINNSGLIRAVAIGHDGAPGDGGSVQLLAGAGDVVNEGGIDVSAASELMSSADGGTVTISGARYGQTGSIVADGQGAGRGGDIAIRMEQAIALNETSRITADGGERGDGGEIIVFAEGATEFTQGGTISARGGRLDGDGGFVEVSGLDFIRVDGFVDVGADQGEAGLWYIDPINVWIYDNAETAGGAFNLNAGSYRWNNAEGPIGQSWIDVTTIQNTLVNNGNVLITTTSGANEVGNIHLDADLDFNNVAAGRTLTFQAENRIYFETGSSVFDSSPGVQGLNLVLNAQDRIVVRSGVSIGLGSGTLAATAGETFELNGASWIAGAGMTIDAGLNIRLSDTSHLDLWTGNLVLTAVNDINLGEITSPTSTSITAGGEIYIPATGLTVAGTLSVNGADILRSDLTRAVDITAGTLNLTSGFAGGDLDIASTVDTLSVTNNGTASISVVDTNGLTLQTIRPLSGGVAIETGAGTDLTIGTAIDLNGMTGALSLSAGRDLFINANIADLTGAINNSNDILLSADSNLSFAAAARVDAGTGDMVVLANGGNLALGQVLANDVYLYATGNITDANGATQNVVGNSLVMEAGGGSIGTSLDGLETTVGSTTLLAQTAAYFSNAGAMSLSINAGGAGNVYLTNTGNLTLTQAAPNLTGIADYTVTGGDLIIPNAGYTVANTLNINARTVRDSDNSVTLNASSASINLQSGGANTTFAVDFDTLVLDVAGVQAVSMSDSDTLSVPFLGSVGNLTLGAVGNLTINDPGPDYASSLTLNSGGTVTVAPGTLVVGNTFTVNAVELTDGDRNIDISATNAVLNLAPAGALTLNTNVADLSLTSSTAQAVTVTDSSGLNISALTTGGATAITSTGGNLSFGVTPTVAGPLTLATLGSGNLVLANTGLTQTGALTITADNLLDSNNTVILAATDANITLRDGATARTWNTSFDTLVASIAGVGTLNVVDSNGLTINALTTGGNANMSSTNANLVVAAAPSVAGNLGLTAITSGDVVLPNAGLSIAGNLTVLADNLRDSDQDLTLTASLADITLRDGSAARTWTTAFDNLVANIAGSGTLSLTNSRSLIVSGFAVGGDASIATNTANLDFNTSTALAGNLTLATVGSGDLRLNGNVDFNGIADGHTLTLDSAGAVILVNGADIYDSTLGDQNLNVVLDSSTYLIVPDTSRIELGAGTFTATTQGTALTGGAFRLEGDAQIQASNVAITANTDVRLDPTSFIDVGTGPLALIAQGYIELGGINSLTSTSINAGDVIYIPTAGLSVSGDLSLIGSDILNEDLSRAVTIGADNLTLASDLAGGDLAIASSLGTFGFTSNGTSALTLVDSDGLTVNGLTSGGAVSLSSTNADLTLAVAPAVAGDLTLATLTSGDVVILDPGLNHSGRLTVTADNLRDADQNLTLSATDATITLRDGSAARTWNTSFDSLTANIAGAGALTLVDSNGLTLGGLATGGAASISSTNADLVFTASPTVTGTLTLTAVTAGDLVVADAGLNHAGALNITADNLRDTDSNVTLAATAANITLRDGAAAQTWNTSFDSLTASIAGTGAFTLIDSNGLTLSGLTTGGAASISSTNADLVLTTSPTVAGTLTLNTVTAGDLVLANAGLNHTGSLSITADNLRDTDSNVTLVATAANITLRDGAAARTWNTSFDSLTASIAGAGAFTLIDSNGLTLNGLTTGGAANISSTNADLVLTASPTVAGSLTLTTVTAGNLVVADAGLNHAGALTITADNLRDTDSNVTLAATAANITLRDGAAAQTWNTSFDSLTASIAGIGAFTLIDSNGLALNGLTTGGAASISSTNADLVLTTSPTVAGTLTLGTVTSGDLVLANAGLNHTAALNITADNLRDTDSNVTLVATAANITLRDGAAARTWNTSFNSLTANIAGAGALTLIDSNGLTLSGLTTGGAASISSTNADLVVTTAPAVAGSLGLTTLGSGDLVIADAGLNHTAALNITADNLVDSSGSVTLAASDASITLRDGALPQVWFTSFDRLTASIAGTGGLTILDSNGLTVDSLSTGGAATLASTNANLVLTASPTVAGNLTLTTVATGDLVIANTGLNHAGALTIVADNLRDADNTVTLAANDANISLRDGATARTWNTSFASLTASIAGTGALTLVDVDALTVNALTTGGAADLTTTNADLTLLASPQVAGDLRLSTTGMGDLIVPDAGLQHGNTLTLDAAHIVDSDSQVTLAATDLGLRQRVGDRDTIFNTNVGSLDLDFVGANALTVVEADALNLVNLASQGDVSVTTGGNLNLLASLDVAGLLSLTTLGAGELGTNATGVMTLGDLTLDVADMLDADRNVAVQANNATIRLRDPASALTLNTQLQQLSLDHQGATPLQIVQTGDLQVNQLSSTGNLSLSADANLTLVEAAPALAGNLNLLVGDTLTIADAGLSLTGDLALTTGTLRNASGMGTLTLQADATDLSVATAVQNDRLTAQVTDLNLTYAGVNPLTVDLPSDTAISGLGSTTDLTLNGLGNLQILVTTTTVAGLLSLQASGDVTLRDTGLQFADALRISAVNLTSASGGDLILQGNSAELVLSGAQPLNLNTQLNQLGVNFAATDLNLLNDRDLQLTGWQAPNATNVGLTVSGTLMLPDTGVNSLGRLSISALDLFDSDRTLDLAAPQLSVLLTNASGDNVWNVEADELDALLRGRANLQVITDGDFALQDLNGDGQAINMTDGNFQLALSGGSLDVNADVLARDQNADGVRGGLIDLQVASGDVRVGLNGDVLIESINNVDGVAASTAGGENGVRLQLTDTSATDRQIILGNGTSTVNIRAVGGDVELNTRPEATASAAKRNILAAEGVSVAAYNSAMDPLDGTVTRNGEVIEPEAWHQAHLNRRITLVEDEIIDPVDLGPILVDDIGDHMTPQDPDHQQGADSSSQFSLAFGNCDEFDKKSIQRCRIDEALKAFLSHWLVGGEMPPKSEI